MFFSFPPGLEIVLTGLIGLVLGSFATAMVARIPEGESWTWTSQKTIKSPERSHCMSCKRRLNPLDLVPLLSYVIQKGACRYCGEKISATYPLIEISTALICLIAYATFTWTQPFLWIVVLSPFLVALMAIDLRHYILPNQLVAIIGVLGLLRLLMDFDLDYCLGAIIYGVSVFVIGQIVGFILKKEALGFGDVKLFSVCGLWLGLSIFPVFLTVCGAMGVVLGIAWKFYTKNQIFPFGPAIIVSFLLLLLTQGLY